MRLLYLALPPKESYYLWMPFQEKIRRQGTALQETKNTGAPHLHAMVSGSDATPQMFTTTSVMTSPPENAPSRVAVTLAGRQCAGKWNSLVDSAPDADVTLNVPGYCRGQVTRRWEAVVNVGSLPNALCTSTRR